MIMAGAHPDNQPTDDSINYMYQLENDERLAFVLSGNDSAAAKNIVSQGELANVIPIRLSELSFPRHNQLYIDDKRTSITDATSKATWKYSHDEKLIVSYKSGEQNKARAIGTNGFVDDINLANNNERFSQIPWLIDSHYILPQSIHYIDFDSKQVATRFTLEGDEHFINTPKSAQKYIFINTNKRTLVFDRSTYFDEYAELSTLTSFTHPVLPSKIWSIYAYELTDGYAVLYLGGDYYGLDKGAASVYQATFDGEFRFVGEKRFVTSTTLYG